MTSTHRGHGHTLAKGADMERMMAELFGKRHRLVQRWQGRLDAHRRLLWSACWAPTASSPPACPIAVRRGACAEAGSAGASWPASSATARSTAGPSWKG
jgi:hypothetical protein